MFSEDPLDEFRKQFGCDLDKFVGRKNDEEAREFFAKEIQKMLDRIYEPPELKVLNIDFDKDERKYNIDIGYELSEYVIEVKNDN